MSSTPSLVVNLYSGLIGITIISIITSFLVHFNLFSARSVLIFLGIFGIILGLSMSSTINSSYGDYRDLHRSNMFGDAYGRHAHETIGNKNKRLIESLDHKTTVLSKIGLNGGIIAIIIGFVFL